MRAEKQCCVAAALVPGVEVADVVPPCRHSGLAHPILDVLVGVAHRVGGERTRDPAWLLGAGREEVAPLQHAPAVHYG